MNFDKEYLDKCIDFNQQLFNFIDIHIQTNSYFFLNENNDSTSFESTYNLKNWLENIIHSLELIKQQNKLNEVSK